MTAFAPIAGSCQCGAVRYRVSAPAEQLYHCHCSMCRRCHGALFATYALAPREGFVLEAGADNLATFSSSPTVHRKFCRTCGCQMFIDVDDKAHLVWYTPGTADGHPGHPAGSERHIYVDSKVPLRGLESAVVRPPREPAGARRGHEVARTNAIARLSIG